MSRAKQSTAKSSEAYRSIGEAASEFGLQTHVLRYWEGRFPRHLRPVKRRDGRRMYRPADMKALRAIQMLVHEGGMTLKGARMLMDEQGVDAVLSGQAILTGADNQMVSENHPRALQAKLKDVFDVSKNETDVTGPSTKLETVLHEMNGLKARLDAARIRSAA